MRLAVILSLMFLPLAQAGTFEDPEIRDTADDVTGPGGAPACAEGACNAAPGFADLDEAWIEQPDFDTLHFRINSANNAHAYGSGDYEWHFTVLGVEYMAGMRTEGQIESDGSAGPSGVATEAMWGADSHMLIVVPLTAIGSPPPGTVITDGFVTSQQKSGGQNTFYDRGPDTGFGREYVIQGPVVSAVDEHVFLEGALAIDLTFANATTGYYNFTWNSTLTGIRLSWAASVTNGTLNATIVDLDGTPYGLCGCNASKDATIDVGIPSQAPGNGTGNETVEGVVGAWTVSVELDDFVGTFDLEGAAVPAPPMPAGPDQNDTPTGNETAEGDNQSPALPVVLMAMALVAMAAVRRRDG